MKKQQLGFSLMESLVAILILAIGALSVLGIQLRSVVENQQGSYRLQAARLTENLSEHLQANPNAFANIQLYVKSMGVLPAISENCREKTCNQAQLVQFDMNNWGRLVQSSLPLGDAAVFVSDQEPDTNRRQLGVLLAWRSNDRVSEKDTEAQKKAYTSAWTITDLPSDISCPSGKMCHLQYIPIVQRCARTETTEADQAFCKTPSRNS